MKNARHILALKNSPFKHRNFQNFVHYAGYKTQKYTTLYNSIVLAQIVHNFLSCFLWLFQKLNTRDVQLNMVYDFARGTCRLQKMILKLFFLSNRFTHWGCVIHQRMAIFMNTAGLVWSSLHPQTNSMSHALRSLKR